MKGARRWGKAKWQGTRRTSTSFFTYDSLNVVIAAVCKRKIFSCFIMQAYKNVHKGSGVRGNGGERRGKSEGARVKGTRRRGKGQGEGGRAKGQGQRGKGEEANIFCEGFALLVNFKKLTSFFTKDSLNVLIASVCDCKLSSCRIMQDSTIVYNI